MKYAVEGVIFDFNGTLFNDSQFHNEAWRLFADSYGISLKPQDYDDHIHGYTNKEIIGYLFERNPAENELADFYEEKEGIYRSICRQNPDKCVLTPGAEEFLDHLLFNGKPRTIATASYLPNVEMYFEMFGLSRWFSIDKIIHDTGDYPGKPHPDMFLAAANKISIPVTKCLIIEDSISGIQAAKNAKADIIVVVNFNNNAIKFSEYGFISEIIHDFRKLL